MMVIPKSTFGSELDVGDKRPLGLKNEEVGAVVTHLHILYEILFTCQQA